jgi:hypothetical protein
MSEDSARTGEKYHFEVKKMVVGEEKENAVPNTDANVTGGKQHSAVY